MTTGTVIRGEQNYTKVLQKRERTEEIIHITKWGFKKKGMDLKSELELS